MPWRLGGLAFISRILPRAFDKGFTMKKLIWSMLVLSAVGCGANPKQAKAPTYVPKPAPQPEAPPRQQKMAIDNNLREAAKKEISDATNSNDPVMRANAL